MIWDDAETELEIATLGPISEETLRQSLKSALASTDPDAADPPKRSEEPPPDSPTPYTDTSSASLAGLKLTRLDDQQSTRLEKPHGCDEVTTLWSWRPISWPSPAEAAGRDAHHDHDHDEDWRVLAALAATCGVLGLTGFILTVAGIGPQWLAIACYVGALAAGAWDAATEALPKVLRGRIDIHFLMLAVAVGAAAIGAWGEAALLLFLFSTAGALEHFALHRTKREINALFHLAPKTATVRTPEGGEASLPIEQIKPGTILLIRPGDTIATDAEVRSGESACDESSLTGEAQPVEKRSGDKVFSGTRNLWGALEATCLRPASESSLQKIINLIQDARHQRAPSQRFTDRFGPGYTMGVLAITALMFFFWWLVLDVPPFLNETTDDGTRFSAFYRAMTLLVVASPCALVLSIPSAILAAIAWGARHGILFRGGAAVEGLASAATVAFDKTGTLTTGELKVVAIESHPAGRESDVARAAFLLEQQASHPIARALVAHGESLGFKPAAVAGFRSLTGLGVRGKIDGHDALLGRRELLAHGPLADWARDLEPPPPGRTEVWFITHDLVGRILLEDEMRTDSPRVIADLQRAGCRTIMLTGDRPEAAAGLASTLGIDETRAGLKPEEKVAAIRELTRKGRRVAMVGDGINDAPALAAADVAVAMGARGSDAALEQSDVVLMNDRISNFLEAFRLSRRATRIIRQNIAISLGTIAIMVVAALGGILPIALGVLAHEGSTVIVCLNSMRLLRTPRE